MRRNRYRYIALRMEGSGIRKEDMITVLNRLQIGESGGSQNRLDRLWLVHFQEGFALVKCGNHNKDRAIALLNSIESIAGKKVAVSTVGTSGTIKAALAKYAK
jgi:RNase P/RNase MRP subunit POP5